MNISSLRLIFFEVISFRRTEIRRYHMNPNLRLCLLNFEAIVDSTYTTNRMKIVLPTMSNKRRSLGSIL